MNSVSNVKSKKIILLTIFVIVALVVAAALTLIFNKTELADINNDPTAPSTTYETPEISPTPIADKEPIDCEVGNFTTAWGSLMLINPNFAVTTDWIAARKAELIDIDATYGIKEGNYYNGTPLMDAEAAAHLSEMLKAYEAYNPGHTMTTRSCFRSVGTNCGRLCYATGTSDHHTGYTCDLVDDYYGDSLDTDTYANHPDWQWLHANSYQYGFIDRFIETWAGGPMSEPVNVDANGTTGLFETWHYRYVGIEAATEIATGKYNNGAYDSLEHYLKASGRLSNLLSPAANCEN